MIAYIAYNKKLVKTYPLSSRRVLILGFGREGKDTLRFLQARFPEIKLAVADKNPNINLQSLKFQITNYKSQTNSKFKIQNLKFKRQIKLHLGGKYLNALKKYSVIIKSPGIPPKVIASYLSKRQIVTSGTEIFLNSCPGTVVGVTGTKGKSTTSAMIYHILKKAGFKVHLVGNIGKPALSSLSHATQKDIFVYELSSHQLYNLKKSPHIAVFLNIFPEHLDYYRSFKEYTSAKANICLWQKKEDYLVYNAGDRLVAGFAKKSRAKKIPIRGKYYGLDRAAAIAVAKIFGISRKLAEGHLRNFQSLPHRLERVGTFQGITFYNDSLSTIPQATIEALDFLGDRVETLIAGGFDRGVNFDGLAKRITESNIAALILFPPSGRRILEAIEKIQNPKSPEGKPSAFYGAGKIQNKFEFQRDLKKKWRTHFFVTTMKDAVRIAYQYTSGGNICLLSPASASFGIFSDYKDRGNAFKRWVKYWGRKIGGMV